MKEPMIDFLTGQPLPLAATDEVEALRRQLGAITNVAIALVRWRGGQCRVTREEIDAIADCTLVMKPDDHGVQISVVRGKAAGE